MNSIGNTTRERRLFGAKLWRTLFATVLLATLMLASVQTFAQQAQGGGGGRRDLQKVKPFKIVGPIYFVGMTDQTVLLIATPQGHIMMDTTWERLVPWIRESVEALGFNMRDIKILINSHGHADHVEGHAMMKELTGAQVVMSVADGNVLANPPAGQDGRPRWKPVKADRLVKEGDTVTLGGVTLTAHVFPGHTRGATSWTTVVEENGRRYNVVLWGGVGGIREPLVNNKDWPTIVEDYTDSVRRAKALPCDIFTQPHGESFGLVDKMNRLLKGEQPNPFSNPQACRQALEQSERAFQEQLAKERAAAR